MRNDSTLRPPKKTFLPRLHSQGTTGRSIFHQVVADGAAPATQNIQVHFPRGSSSYYYYYGILPPYRTAADEKGLSTISRRRDGRRRDPPCLPREGQEDAAATAPDVVSHRILDGLQISPPPPPESSFLPAPVGFSLTPTLSLSLSS